MSKISLKHSGGNVVSLNSPTSAPTSSDVAFKLPNQDGSASEALITDGSGNLSFASVAGGKVLQIVSSTKTDTLSETIASGVVGSAITGLTVSITPSNASNKILLICSLSISAYDNSFLFYKDGSVISGATGDADGTKKRIFAEQYLGSGYTLFGCTHHYVDTAGGTSAITYGPRVQNTTTASRTYKINANINGRSGVGGLDLVGASTFTAVEVSV